MSEGGPGTILVVDDEVIVRTLAELILNRGGYRVICAEDGQAGLDIVRQAAQPIDLALVDLTMPRLSGPELIEEIRKIRPELPVVFTSGHPENEAVARYPVIQTCRYVQKPFAYDQLLALAKELTGH